MKRLYVTPAFQGRGLGRRLAEAVIAEARHLGYAVMRLDTVTEMTAANRLYRFLGFRPIPAYRHNPLETAAYYELPL
jgi:ribosomal protein S18 acetylase RimI-like enzyme